MTSPESEPARRTRLSINIGQDTAEILREYARRKGVSVTETVRRAVAVLHEVDQAIQREESIYMGKDGGKVKEICFLI